MFSKKSVIIFFGLILAMGYVCCAQAENESESKVYLLPHKKSIRCKNNNCNFPQEGSLETAKCSLKGGVTFCTDQSGNPITGEIVKYNKGIVIRRYAMKDGYLDGTSEAYDKNGYKVTTLIYDKGKLNGIASSYNRQGGITARIPYVNDKKEGVAEYINQNTTLKTIYIDDKINGASQIWCNNEKKKIYDLEMSNGYVARAIYYHYDSCNKDSTSIKQESLPPLLIDAVNMGCAELKESFTDRASPVNLNLETPDCRAWGNEHMSQLKNLAKLYACPNK